MEQIINNDLKKARMIKVIAWGIIIPVVLIFAGALDIAISAFKDPSGVGFLLMALYCAVFVCVIGSIVIKSTAKLNYRLAVTKLLTTLFLFLLPVVCFIFMLRDMAGID
jgi:hypothetical protein